MSTYYPFDHTRWGNRLVVNRSLDLWRQYGAEAALFDLKGDWSRFVFTGDARNLALIPKTISEKADEIFDHELSQGLEVWGAEMHQNYTKEDRAISSRERNTWKKAFIEAYSEQIEENISEIIPPELEDKLDAFCSIVGAIAHHLQAGGDPEDFGVSLGKKVQEKEVRIHPRKAQIISRATREGAEEGRRNWGWQESAGYSIRAPYISTPYDWDMNSSEEELYEETYARAYFSVIRHQVEKAFPKKAWKNAYLICSLYDEMQYQKDRKKKYGSQKGWGYIRSERSHALFMEKQREEDARKFNEARFAARKQPPTMGISDLRPQFGSPQFAITPEAKAAFEESGEQPSKFLDRHFSGDFGEVTSNDAELNQEGMSTGGQVWSIYRLNTGIRFYIITDAGHMLTTILLDDQY